MRVLIALAAVACSKSEPPPPQPAATPAVAPRPPPPKTDCVISIYAEPTTVWVGTTAGTCHIEGAALESELRSLRDQFRGTCMPLVEIAVAAGVYQDIIGLMDLSVQVGFIDTAISTKQELSVPLPSAHPDLHCVAPAHPTVPPPAPGGPTFTPKLGKNGEIVAFQSEPLDLPPAEDNKNAMQVAPVIIVTKTELTFQQQRIALLANIPSNSPRYARLAEPLEAEAKKIEGELGPSQRQTCEEARRGIRPKPGHVCPEGLVILQADESTPAGVIYTIVQTAKSAGFDNLLFAVKNR